jgi:hypothetical protein
MTLDVQGLQGRVRRLVEEASEIQRILDEAATTETTGAVDTGLGASLGLPSEILVPDPSVVVTYLGAHPDLIDIVRDLAATLVHEFRDERSEIELSVYEDPEIDDRSLTFYVRLPEYDESLMPRLDAVTEKFDERFTNSDDFVLVTTDYYPPP